MGDKNKRSRTERISAKTKRLALSAMLSALSFVLLYVGSIIEVLDLSAAALASMVLAVAVIEVGGAYPFGIYLATSLLSLLLLPYKLPALLFLMFAGYYPMLKSFAEHRKPVLSWIIKFIVFNLALTLTTIVADKLFGLADSLFALSPIVYLIGNAAFLLYDIALTRVITFYIFNLRKRIGMRKR